jgi:hypothetical protein
MEYSESNNLLNYLFHLVNLSKFGHQQELSLLLLLIFSFKITFQPLYLCEKSTFFLHLLFQFGFKLMDKKLQLGSFLFTTRGHLLQTCISVYLKLLQIGFKRSDSRLKGLIFSIAFLDNLFVLINLILFLSLVLSKHLYLNFKLINSL